MIKAIWKFFSTNKKAEKPAHSKKRHLVLNTVYSQKNPPDSISKPDDLSTTKVKKPGVRQ